MTRTVRGRLPGEQAPLAAGRAAVPASKSHTIRALLIAAFADGESRLRRPLPSRDTLAARAAVEFLGARVSDDGDDWLVQGFGAVPEPASGTIDVGNSGTTLYLATALAALTDRPVTFDGDAPDSTEVSGPLCWPHWRPWVQPWDYRGNGGCAPFTVTGPLQAGTAEVDCPVSQYLSGLLLAAPLIPRGASNLSIIKIRTLNEAPYVGITLDWLKEQGIRYEQDGWDEFRVPGGQSYRPFDRVVPADWSSATFFLAAAAITGGSLILEGVDMNDSQGDKLVVSMLETMGCKTEPVDGGLQITGRPLTAATLDLNATPDALPAMAAVCCFAEGESRLVNVPQARLKETDRITVMCSELLKLGADVEELADGMVIRGRRPSPKGCRTPVLKGAVVDGHDDHRVVMALAMAALGSCGEVSIRGAEAADVTFPGFFELLDSVVRRT